MWVPHACLVTMEVDLFVQITQSTAQGLNLFLKFVEVRLESRSCLLVKVRLHVFVRTTTCM